MKKIVAYIKPFVLDDTIAALNENALVRGITVSEVHGMGRQRGHTELYRGAEYAIEFHPKIKLEVVLKDKNVDAAVALIQASAYTGKTGDGKIFVVPVEQAIRIRTGENGARAL